MMGSLRKRKCPTRLVVNTLGIIEAIDIIIKDYVQNGIFPINWRSSEAEQKEREPTMQSEKLALEEMNVELWENALMSALTEISCVTYPHTETIKALINCLLNDYGKMDLGVVAEILDRLLIFHPPNKDYMVTYYKKLLHDNYAQINQKGTEMEPFIWVLLEQFCNLPAEKVKPSELMGWDIPPDNKMDDIESTINSGCNITEKLRELVHKKSVVYVTNCKRYYNKLTTEKQYLRINMCMKFVCDLLETEFSSKIKNCKRGHQVKCLLSELIWPDIREIGQITPKLNKVIGTLFKRTLGDSSDTNRLLSMVAWLVNYSDTQEKEYPFIGSHSLDLARAVSLLLLERIKTSDDSVFAGHVMSIKPPWFRMLCCCHILGTMAGFHCPPELLPVITVLEYILQVFKGQITEQPCTAANNDNTTSPDRELVSKYSKWPSVNKKDGEGATELHRACRKNKKESVRALLEFALLDVNQADNAGWTALHDAAARGSTDCVQLLLSFSPKIGTVQRPVDTRAWGPQNRTPLMLAVQNGHQEVCTLLLQHTGSVLLSDITDDNETAIDLCDKTNKAMLKILMHYKKNLIETIHSQKRLHLTTNDHCRVVRMCCILIQSYMAIHRTWDVYHKMKEIAVSGAKRSRKSNFVIQYSRYHRDLKTNLPRLRALSTQLQKFEEIAAAADDLNCLLSLNKS